MTRADRGAGSIPAAVPPSGRRSRRCARRRASCTTRSTRTRGAPASPTCIPTSRPCSSTCSARRSVIAWQEGKAAFLFASEGCWSELPHLYARYGTTATAALIARLKALEHAARRAGLRLGHAGHRARLRRADGRRAARRADAAGLQQDPQLPRVAGRRASAASVTIVDDGDHAALAAAIRPETRFVFAETFTNPLVRAQDLDALRDVDRRGARDRRRRCGSCSTPRSPRRGRSSTPLLDRASTSSSPAAPRRSAATIATCGATSRPTTPQFANAVMDLMAMRGGILDWRRADGDRRRLRRRRARRTRGDRRRASRVAAFLAAHPKVSEVFHPSLPTHPDAARDRARTTCGTARCSRSASPAPTRSAPATSPTCSPRRVDRPLRAVVRRPGDQGQPPPDRVRVLHAARPSCSATASIG